MLIDAPPERRAHEQTSRRTGMMPFAFAVFFLASAGCSSVPADAVEARHPDGGGQALEVRKGERGCFAIERSD